MDLETLRRHHWNNRLQSLLLVSALAAMMGYLGWMVGGIPLLLVAIAGAGLIYLFNPMNNLRLTLRLYRTTPLHPRQVPALYQALAELCQRAGLENPPQLHYLPSRTLNAFAVGDHRQAAIVLSDGLLRSLDLEQLVGVLGHEIAHIQHRDLRLLGFADSITRLTSLFSLFGLMLLLLNLPLLLILGGSIPLLPILLLIVAPYLSTLLQLALSRTREYEADRRCCVLLGSARPLIRALQQIENQPLSLLQRLLLPGRRQPEPSLIRTHPPTDERLRRLQALDADPLQQFPPLPLAHRQPTTTNVLRSLRDPRWRIWGHWY